VSLKAVPNKKLGELMGVPQHAPRKLNIAGGQRGTPGFKSIDLHGDADITHDLFKFPWPIKSSSVTEILCSHFIEHVPTTGRSGTASTAGGCSSPSLPAS